jgi:hypothetical protein
LTLFLADLQSWCILKKQKERLGGDTYEEKKLEQEKNQRRVYGAAESRRLADVTPANSHDAQKGAWYLLDMRGAGGGRLLLEAYNRGS